jgi:hypothetical protein
MHTRTNLPSGLKRGLRFIPAIAIVLLPLALATARQGSPTAPPVYGPRICLDARFWNTPGWQPRAGDYGYVRGIPGRMAAPDIRRALADIPAASRMLRSATMASMEQILHQLIEVERFKLASLGYDLGDSQSAVGAGARDAIDACKRGQALAQKFGLTFFVYAAQTSAEQFADQLAGCADLLSVDDAGSANPSAAAAVEEQRKLDEKLLAANPRLVIFQSVTAPPEGNTQPPQRLLRYYQGNADLVQGILVNAADARAQVGRLLRAIRPQLGQAYAVAPDEGPSMYFFTFHWKTPGWRPRAGDYATAKIRPQLKTFEEKVAYVLEDLKDVAPENRMVQFNSLAGAADLLKEVVEARHFRLACLGYDLEDWNLTSGEEKADPVVACKNGQALANKYGMDFIVTPDMPMSRKWGSRVAPFINAIKPQCKGTQAESIDKAIVSQRKLYGEIRRANPDVRILHDVGISPKGKLQTPEGLVRYYAGVADLVDGIGVFSVNTPEQNAVMEKYIVGVRPPFAAAGKARSGQDRRAK